MGEDVKTAEEGASRRRYDGSRRQAQLMATRVRVTDAAKTLFIDQGYPATTIDAISAASEVPLPTLYRLFGSKRGVLKAVFDTAFGGDDEPVAFVNRPQVQAALAEPDADDLLDRFARIARELMDRSAAIQHVLATAATVDAEAAELLEEIRRQRHVGQSRIVAAVIARDALDPSLTTSDAEDTLFALLSPELHRILTVERGWSADHYETWLAWSMKALLLISR
jgi:AcrR family transcriptional regulator